MSDTNGNGKEVSTIVLMTEAEAKQARDEINNESGKYYARQRARVLEFFIREGWRALGYENWTDCLMKEFDFNRRRAFQLLDEATIESELKTLMGGKTPDLSGRALRALADVPPEQRPEVAEAAAEETPAGKTTGAGAVRKAWKTSGKKKPAAAKKKKEPTLTIGEQAQDNEKLHQALMNIGDTCSRNFRKAIEDGTIELSKSEVLEIAGLDDEKMQEVANLVGALRWKVSRAIKYLDKAVELSDPIEVIHNLAVASLEDKWEGDFGAGHCVYTISRRKLKAAE